MTDLTHAKAAARPGVVGWRPLIDVPNGFVSASPCNHVHKTSAAAEACAQAWLDAARQKQAECQHGQVLSSGQQVICRDCGFIVNLKKARENA